MQTLEDLARALASGALRARQLVDEALDRIADPDGEGSRAFMTVASQTARAQADEVDRKRAAGVALPEFAGIPIAIKDLFDVAGEVTRAGSRILANEPPALRDAPVIARLRAAGFIFIGRNTMTEFAFSGLGLNPHYGTPASPFDRATGRIPGGSTSGGAVAVADGMAAASLGTDTGGSCRIPAAFCGIVGFKPTAHRVPRDGVTPLAHSLDSIGPLANSVSCCVTLDALVRGVTPRPVASASLSDIRLLLPTSLALNDLDEHVTKAFERGVDELARAGVSISQQPLPELMRIPEINSRGGIATAEAYAWHRPLLERFRDRYDPRVANRILKAADFTDQYVREMHDARAEVIAGFERAAGDVDALVLPTTPIIPPPFAAFAHDADYARLNVLVLRNPSLANFLDGCAISLPIHRQGEPPVGLMLIGRRGTDERLLAIAQGIEGALDRRRLC
ncbi:amidase [Peristeroidobacter agariperforans]|uniref:amidase n=1 Tax=Peristeroidobacter agariperforans TaxID=268404 RepID=UPI00101C67D6|nr:amidase [Peristeroidobacter agariperforans]